MSEILLSVSILISNRPDTVEKCLKSLASLRAKVPCELILVDTGCGERVRKMIEPYADKIAEFAWCNDFSRARNEGLKLAKGKWFLYLDDDEWFEDTGEIEEFFLSGKYLCYNCGSYLQRNYFNREGTRYCDDYVGRLIRLRPDTKFIYSIHEGFSEVYDPRIRLHSYVHHYGYVFQNEEEAQKHSWRNISLLLAEHEKDPWQLRHNAQLAQEYNALQEWEKSVEISLQGIQNAGSGISAEQFLGGLYTNAVRNYVTLGRDLDAIQIGERYLGLSCSNELARAAVRYNLCIAYLEKEEYRKSLNAVEEYLVFYAKWEADRDATAFYECLTVPFMSRGCRQAALCIGVQAAVALENFALARGFFARIDWEAIQDIQTTQSVQGMIQVLVRAWLRPNEDSVTDCTDMLGVLLKAGILAEMVTAELDWQNMQEMQGDLRETLNTDGSPALTEGMPCRMRKFRRRAAEKEEGRDDRTSAEDVVRELLAYSEENKRVYCGLYREELFWEKPDLLPRSCQVSLKLLDMGSAAEEGDFQRALSDIREALEIMPELSDSLKCCTKWVSEKADFHKEKQDSEKEEMSKLAEAVKAKVRILADQGMLKEAAEIMRQLKLMMPQDEEAKQLEHEIAQRMAYGH